MSTRKLPKLPQFANEAEEAQWWYDHREELAQDFVNAVREGRTGPGSVARLRAKLEAQKIQESKTNDEKGNSKIAS